MSTVPVEVHIRNIFQQPVANAYLFMIATFPAGGTIPWDGYTDSNGNVTVNVPSDQFPIISWSITHADYMEISGTGTPPTIVTLSLLAPTPPIPNSGQGHLYINPIEVNANPDRSVTFTPEASVQYPEGCPEFDYILSLIGMWNYTVSPTIAIPDTSVQADVVLRNLQGDITGSDSKVGSANAFIYGWIPGSPNWEPNSCTAIVTFGSPTITAAEDTVECTVQTAISGNLTFSSATAQNVTIIPFNPTNLSAIAVAGAVIAGSVYYLDKRNKKKRR